MSKFTDVDTWCIGKMVKVRLNGKKVWRKIRGVSLVDSGSGTSDPQKRSYCIHQQGHEIWFSEDSPNAEVSKLVSRYNIHSLAASFKPK